MNKERRNPMEIFEYLEKELILAKAKVEVITDLMSRFAPTPVCDETEHISEYETTQTITDNSF
jgi:hypothetical protein